MVKQQPKAIFDTITKMINGFKTHPKELKGVPGIARARKLTGWQKQLIKYNARLDRIKDDERTTLKKRNTFIEKIFPKLKDNYRLIKANLIKKPEVRTDFVED